MNQIDVDRVRADTPGCASVIHLGNAGAALQPQPVVDAVIGYLQEEALVGGYEQNGAAADDIAHVYDAGARLVGCERDELAMTSGASEAWWRAFLSIPLEAGDRVLIGRTEYSSNALALLQAVERGVSVEVVSDDPTGQIDLGALAAMLDDRVKLVALTSVAMTNGLVNPTAEVGALVKDAGAYFLVDACQVAGQLPIDVEAWRCDFLSFTGRKFVRGPRGTGLLYVRRQIMDELLAPTFIDGRSATWSSETSYDLAPTAQRFEFFERSFAAMVGFGVAMTYAADLGLDAIEDRISMLADHLRSGLDEVPGVRVLDTGVRRCGIVTFDVEGVGAVEVMERLSAAGINVNAPDITGSRYDLVARGVDVVVRAGVHYYNTIEELDRTVAEVAAL